MIKGDLSRRKKEEWTAFMERLEIGISERKRRRKRTRYLPLLLFVLAAALMLFSGKPAPREYVNAAIPLKDSPALIVDNGCVVQSGQQYFMITMGAEK